VCCGGAFRGQGRASSWAIRARLVVGRKGSVGGERSRSGQASWEGSGESCC
jgi:hypothetical protein